MIQHPDGDPVTVPTACGLKEEFGIYHHVLRMSSFQPFAPCSWKKMLSHLYLSVSLTLLTALFVWYIQVYVCMYITYMLYAELCFYSIYNMSSHIIYLICKRKFFSSVISHLETCGNEFACVCSFFLQYQGWQLPASPMHLRTDLGCTKTLLHVAEDDQRLFLPH